MDIHQTYRILQVPGDGIVSLTDPDIAAEVAPLVGFAVTANSVKFARKPEGTLIGSLGLAPGKHIEIEVPAWSACILVVHDGFCLTGTDGESPDARVGQYAIYRRRNRDSALILVAGPEGCIASLITTPTAD
jgi:hypothetical protein